ncbi:ABC transporter permease subunit [Paenisporosarcina sp. OV554]|uniref:ABC transporter permease subunit n=1 Tax=Paenisporosarcina sp. OV554 TaxID=2135694 RepID=UPI000D3736F1|nr:ABC transporter permease subunit [Paenisporosarcina sp. OV554]PUB13339.1 ABC-2 type transport system permease protein [Paenisporosarcina sp. OV554]
MKNLIVLFQKEWRENTRNFKILWIPLVFIFFGLSEPLTSYYLPQILEAVGNLPEDAVFSLPEFTAAQVIMATMGQYQFFGMLVLVLGFAGTISRERKNGTGTLIYVRPISYLSYFLSKWKVIGTIALVSVWLGLLTTWYYTELLFGKVDTADFFAFAGTYSVWILFVVTIVVAMSAWLPTGAAATVSLLLVLLVQIVDSLLGAYWTISPWKLAIYATQWLTGSPDATNFWWSIVVTLIAIVGLVVFGVWMSKRNASKTKI